MTDSATKTAKAVKDSLVSQARTAGVNSLALGLGVTVVAFAVQAAVIAANGAFGAGQGVVDGLKIRRP